MKTSLPINDSTRVRSLLAALVFGSAALSAWSATTIPELLGEYVVGNRLDDTVEVHQFTVDLDSDGVDEVLITDDTAENAKAGYFWTVFQNQSGRFVEIEGAMELRLDTLTAGIPEGTMRLTLASFHPGGGESGKLHGYFLDYGQIREIDWGEVRPGQPLAAICDELFESNASLSVVTTLVRELRERHPDTFAVAIANPDRDAVPSTRSPNTVARWIPTQAHATIAPDIEPPSDPAVLAAPGLPNDQDQNPVPETSRSWGWIWWTVAFVALIVLAGKPRSP